MGSQPLYTQVSPNHVKLSAFVDYIEVWKYLKLVLQISLRGAYTAIMNFMRIFRFYRKKTGFSKIMLIEYLSSHARKVPTILYILKASHLSYILTIKCLGLSKLFVILCFHVPYSLPMF